jgi:hypothetical protein
MDDRQSNSRSSAGTRRGFPALDRWTLAVALLLLAAVAVMLATFLDYGLTWDEERQHVYAGYVLDWYRTWGRNRAALAYFNLQYYGGFFEIVAESIGRLLPLGIYEGRHLVNVLFGWLGLWGAYRLGSLIAGPRAGFFSAAFLLFIPEFYGHAFNNPKDLPLASLSVWSLFAILKAAREVPAIRWQSVAWVAISLGLVLGVRVGAVFHVGYLAFAWVGALALWYWQARPGRRAFLGSAGRVALALGIAAAGAWATMLLFWPYGQVRPIEHTLEAVKAAERFDYFQMVRFGGWDVPATLLPRLYLPVMLSLKLPEYLGLALVAGAAVCVMQLRRGRELLASSAQGLQLSVVAMAVVLPIALVMLLHSTLYDGIRHFLFILPPLATLAGIGFSAWLDAPVPRAARQVVAAGVALGVAYTGWQMVTLHPYQTAYFNLRAGGLKGAAPRFETDYWGNSYREAAEWVFRNVAPSNDRPLVVQNCSDDFLSSYFIDRNPEWRKRFVGKSANRPPDIFLATERFHCHEKDARVLHVVRRQGTALAYVFDMRGAKTGAGSPAK